MYQKKLYVSGGSFYELQAVFQKFYGVLETSCGYINAEKKATFEEVAAGKIAARMGLEIVYDPKKTDISSLMDLLFSVVTPHLPDGQGKARGEMYRAGVYFSDAEDEPHVQLHMAFIQTRGKPPKAACGAVILNDPNSKDEARLTCYAEAKPLQSFQRAEEEHQNYLKKHVNYECFIDVARLEELGILKKE